MYALGTQHQSNGTAENVSDRYILMNRQWASGTEKR